MTDADRALPPDVDEALRTAEELRLVTRGRRSGREHAVTLWFAYEPGVVWLRTDLRRDRPPDWYRNLLHDPACRIEVEGQEVEGRVEPLEDADAALKRVVHLLREKYGPDWVSDWYVDFGRQPVRIRLRAPAGASGT